MGYLVDNQRISRLDIMRISQDIIRIFNGYLSKRCLGMSLQDNYGYVKDNTEGYWRGYLFRISLGYLKDI